MVLLDIGLRASLVLIAALAASVALRHRSAALRHWILAVGIFSAAAVGPLGWALPKWDLPVQPAMAIEARIATIQDAPPRPIADLVSATGETSKAAAPRSRFTIEQWVGGVWAAGFAISLLLMLAGFRRLVLVTNDAAPRTGQRWVDLNRELSARLNVREAVAVLKTSLPGMVGTWGWRHPVVLLPSHCESWDDERIRIVLGHELAHIRRADWLVQVAAELVRAAFWYNPLFWIACARLRRESEQACDNTVLEAGVPADQYASH